MTFSLVPFHRLREAVRRGDVARAASRFPEAIEAYTEAMVVRGDDLTPDQEADLRVRIAECSLDLGDLEAVDLVLARVATLDPLRILPRTRGAALVARGRVALYRGDHRGAAARATEAWEILRDTGENGRVAAALTLRGHARRHLGALDDAREDYTDALAAARRAGDEHAVGLAAANLGTLHWKSGRYRDARRWHRRAVEIHERTRSAAHLDRELLALAVDEYHAGDWAQVDALLTRADERARRTGDRRLLSAVTIAGARLELARGGDPRPRLETARELAGHGGFANDLVLVDQLLGEAALARGDRTEARRRLVSAWERATAQAPDGEAGVDVAWRLALAEESLGDPESRVVAMLERAAACAARHGYRYQGAQARRALGEALAARGRIDEARGHLEHAVGVFRDLRIPYETGRSLVSLGAFLATAGGEPATCAPLFREAEAILRRLGAERDRARAAEGLAAAVGEPARHGAARGDGDAFDDIATVAPGMERAIGRARRIAPSDIPVLITGETGTGKELFACAIHRASRRRDAPFLAVNCAALTESLLEAELFGHVKGAFTGAIASKTGIFEAADGGTVFLDEIGKAPPALQAKLLRVLDCGEVRRVGGVETVRVDVRIVAATNRPLVGLVADGAFLPDLLYRLRGYEIAVPPLRERSGDVPHLFARFARRPASAAALAVLEAHDWPGNVREMRNLAESVAFLTAGTGPVPVDGLPEWLRESARARVRTGPPRLHEAERDAVVRALRETGGNRSAAARALGISRQTLYTKMAKHGIGRADAA